MDDNRRQWLRGLLPKGAQLAGKVMAEAIDRRVPPRRRPPGAVAEPLFLAACTRCDKCVEACPYNSIYTLKPGIVGAGTPVMVPDERPCHVCTDFPCVAACEPNVLKPPTAQTLRMGTVTVNPAVCMPFRGPECGACAGLCPEQAPALTMVRRKPQIDAEICIGCGLCIDACPTTPKALDLRPL